MLSTNSRAARLDSGRSASNPTTHRLAPRALLAGSLAFALIACAPAAVTPTNGSGGKGNGGSSGNGGSGSGGTSAKGGSSGNGSGGSGSGGTSAKGGSAGNSSGGAGGNGSGGTSAKGGSAGNSSGGAGGVNSGGNGSGGSAGGASGSGSGGAAGNGSGGSVGGASGANPPGWYMTSDWNVTSANWQGCVWTGVDCSSNCPAGITAVAGSTTSITPTDFTAATKEGGPYEVSGTVFNDYNAVAMIGFNLNETTSGKSDQCKYNAAAAAAAGPPVATVPGSATGIAVNWSAKIAPVTSFRIQIQGVNGATDPTNRWCATITDASGPSFVPFTDFSTQCWTGATNPVAYNKEPIDAVVFLVPGTTTAKAPFDFTITGFAPGTSKADAPGGAAACGTTTGTVGTTSLLSDSSAATDASTQRAAVTGTDCKKYIINNNNWGNETTTYQSLNYTGNSFTDVVTSGSGGGSNVVSFPSIYIGGNGQTTGGTTSTWTDSGLPKQISAMKSAQTSFKWSGGTSGGNYNAAYDVWFAKTPPTGEYDDGVSGLLMVWLYKPGSSQPIGTKVRTATGIAGHNWDVWAGTRNTTAKGTDVATRPVISYVAQDSPITSLSFDLKNFIDDAVSNADTANGITQAFSSSWYLTDVFAGFEIWNGGDAKGLQDTFTCVVQ